MTPAKLAFVDTETTGLNPDLHELWEIGIVTADPYEDGSGYEFGEYVVQLPISIERAESMALSISGFYNRADQWLKRDDTSRMLWGADDRQVAEQVIELTKDRHFVGAVPSFDANFIGKFLKRHHLVPTWHYHLIDVEHLAAGFLAYKGRHDQVQANMETVELARPPWKSDDLAAAVGVTIAPEDRHTALGDARWARDIYFAVMGGQ